MKITEETINLVRKAMLAPYDNYYYGTPEEMQTNCAKSILNALDSAGLLKSSEVVETMKITKQTLRVVKDAMLKAFANTQGTLDDVHEAAARAAIEAVLHDIPIPSYAEILRQREALWMLLDDIDTLDDACKSSDTDFRTIAYKIQRKRFAIWNPETEK